MAMRKKRTKKRTKVTVVRPALSWATTTQISASLSHGNVQLAMSLTQVGASGPWHLIALETDVDANLQAILSSHAHQFVGAYNDLFVAMQAATDYAQQWLKRKPRRTERCDCTDID